MFSLDPKVIEAVQSECIEYLCEYLKIDTSNPPGVTSAAIEFWIKIYERENIPYKVYTHSSGKQSICGFLYGQCAKSEKSIILLNHLDVVPADGGKWDFNPFQGDEKDSYIRGRGALDMKGLAIIQLMAALIIKKNNYPLSKNLFILSVADEETGGFYGAKFIVENCLPELNPTLVLDEGAFGFVTKKQNIFLVSYTQKKTLWLKICAHGKQGHGAKPSLENANTILINALHKIEKKSIHKSSEKEALLYSSLQNEKWYIQAFVNFIFRTKLSEFLFQRIKTHPLLRILYFNTVSVTSISSRSAPNVIPEYAEATLDCRLTPETDVEKFIRDLRKLMADHRISIEIIKRTDKVSRSDCNHEIINVIHNVISSNFKRARLIPFVTPVGTDSKYFRDAGIDSYGFYPILLKTGELDMMHGINEQISVGNMVLGIKLLTEVLVNYKNGGVMEKCRKQIL